MPSYYLTNESSIINIGDAIRAKNEESASYIFPSEFISKIQSIKMAGNIGSSTKALIEGTIQEVSGSCTVVSTCAFQYCSLLTSVYFPSCSRIGVSAFYLCSNLQTISFPTCQMITSYAFMTCRNISVASFPCCSTIGISAFTRCFNLISLYLMGSSVASLLSSNAFSSTPIGGYTTSTGGVYGSIYVPSSMLSSYKTRTNWTYFSARMVGV